MIWKYGKNITIFEALFRCFEVKILKYIQMNLMRPPTMGKRALTELTKVTLCRWDILLDQQETALRIATVSWFWKPPQVAYPYNYSNTFYIKSVLSYWETLFVMHRISSLLMAATESSLHQHPSWQCWSKAAASREHQTPLTHIAFQKIYLEPRSTATTGKGKRRKMDAIIADIKAASLNTWAHRWFVHLQSPFGWTFT